jgi:2-oxoglutarate ferredoxin oxidoreductase subunit beta
MRHKGFSIIDVAQPCVSYNPHMSYQWYQERVYKIEEVEGYNPKDKAWAMLKAMEDQEEKIPTGVFYHNPDDRETYVDDLPEDAKLPLVKQDISNIDIENLLDNYE